MSLWPALSSFLYSIIMFMSGVALYECVLYFSHINFTEFSGRGILVKHLLRFLLVFIVALCAVLMFIAFSIVFSVVTDSSEHISFF